MGQLFHSVSTSIQHQEDDTNEQLSRRKSGYFINLDPATIAVPFNANIDIRDTVDYKVRFNFSSIVLTLLQLQIHLI